MASLLADRQVLIFVTIISAALILTASAFVFNLIHPVVFALLLILAAFVFALAPRVVEFKEYERGVLFRMGRLKGKGIVGPGWVWVFPFIDAYNLVDTRVRLVTSTNEKFVSSDGVEMTIDIAVNYKVADPVKFVTAIKDVDRSIGAAAVSAIRESVSKVTYLEAVGGAEKIDAAIAAELRAHSTEWGIAIVTADVERVTLPKDLLTAMREKEEAEQKRDAIETEASIKQVYLERLDEAARKLSPATFSYLYLDALRKMSFSKAGKIVIPYEFSKLAALLGAGKE